MTFWRSCFGISCWFANPVEMLKSAESRLDSRQLVFPPVALALQDACGKFLDRHAMFLGGALQFSREGRVKFQVQFCLAVVQRLLLGV
ncbi:MAG: hypothetical protein ACREAY_00545 [Nitrososphaera sp.]